MNTFTWDYTNKHFKAYTRIGAWLKIKRYVYSKQYTHNTYIQITCFAKNLDNNTIDALVFKSIKNGRKNASFRNVLYVGCSVTSKNYINMITGEVVECKNKLQAFKYFKQDGKKYGYVVKWSNIQQYKED